MNVEDDIFINGNGKSSTGNGKVINGNGKVGNRNAKVNIGNDKSNNGNGTVIIKMTCTKKTQYLK